MKMARYIPLLAWIATVLVALLIPLSIISKGFLPVGDARRHVAKAFTEKPYTQIVVMRPEYTMDHSPGWEWLLGGLRRIVGMDIDGLMSFSIVSLFLCLCFFALPWLKRPEAW